MMRVALAGISHETNTYASPPTPLSAFHVRRGEGLLRSAGQQSDLGGAIDACVAAGCNIVPIIYAITQPSGIIEAQAYASLKQELLDRLQDAGHIDACVLLLHGAGVVEDLQDLEGDLCASVRDLLGPDVPITASFDLHGNITPRMAEQLNGIFACRHYPHIDLHERAAQAVDHALSIASGGPITRCRVITLPMLLPTTTTYEGIGASMLEELLSLQENSGAVDISWFHGFPYTDVGHVGSYVTVTAAADNQQAWSNAARFAESLWQQREQFRARGYSAADAVAAALEVSGGPVVIHETSDNCGGGSPGNGTHLLRAMLQAELGADACFCFLVDAQAARLAHQAGVGATLTLTLGEHTDELHGGPIEVEAYVKALHDGRLVMQTMFKGSPIHLGLMARLVVNNMDVVVASNRNQTVDQAPFLAVGIDVMQYKTVALKSSNHFRAGFQDIAEAIITADPPGLTTHHIDVFPRHFSDRPLWPLAEDVSFNIDT